MLTVYVYDQCSTCRKALAYLDARGIAYRTRPIRSEPPSTRELDRMLKFHGGNIRALFNTSGKDFRQQRLSVVLNDMTPTEAVARLHENGNLVKRPFLLTPRLGLVGFRPDAWDAAFASSR